VILQLLVHCRLPGDPLTPVAGDASDSQENSDIAVIASPQSDPEDDNDESGMNVSVPPQYAWRFCQMKSIAMPCVDWAPANTDDATYPDIAIVYPLFGLHV